jgi:hypothetical protein
MPQLDNKAMPINEPRDRILTLCIFFTTKGLAVARGALGAHAATTLTLAMAWSPRWKKPRASANRRQRCHTWRKNARVIEVDRISYLRLILGLLRAFSPASADLPGAELPDH